MSIRMDLSAVVLSFNSIAYIERCVRDLFDSYDKCNYQGEVIVIENGSSDGSVDILKNLQIEFEGKLQVIYSDENLGTTRSRNLGFKASKGEIIIVLDSDAYMNSEALEGLKLWLENKNDYGLIAPKLTFPDGRYQLSIDTFPTITRKVKRFFLLKQIENSQKIDFESNYDIDYAISACWMFRRSLYESIGGLDENIFYAPEDVDFCLRVWKSGKKIAYLPTYSIIHDAQEVSRGFKINKFVLLHIKGLIYYFIKHRYFFSLTSLYSKLHKNEHMQKIN
jgi:GT2 family glycosyltransferase